MSTQKDDQMIGEYEMLLDIPGYSNYKNITKINKGWSDDLKFYAETLTGEKRIIRVADIKNIESKKKEYEIIQRYGQLGFEMSKPVDFGICNSKKSVYMVLTWVEGNDLKEELPYLSEKTQYELGRKAGEILKSIHSIPVSKPDIPEKNKREKKLKQLEKYEKSELRIRNDETAVQYIKDNIHKIWSAEPVYQHGDFHPGNLILTPGNEIGVIDFNRFEVGDPFEEFYKLESFGTETSIPYCIGQIDAYFDEDVPEFFWEVLAVYVAHASLYSIKWAEKFGQEEIEGMVKRCKTALEHYDGFKKCIPSWYEARYRNRFHIR